MYIVFVADLAEVRVLDVRDQVREGPVLLNISY